METNDWIIDVIKFTTFLATPVCAVWGACKFIINSKRKLDQVEKNLSELPCKEHAQRFIAHDILLARLDERTWCLRDGRPQQAPPTEQPDTTDTNA